MPRMPSIAMSELHTPRYIAVEGPIGVGKTSLARRLAQTFGSELLLEGADENPFLERFYADPRGAAFATQLHFLVQRAEQLRALRQADLFETTRIADFLFDKDPLFARLNLDDNEYALYRKVYEHLAPELPTPDLVIYLQAPVDVLRTRIARRGIPCEQGIAPRYLQALSDAYVAFFHDYETAPLLIVNAAEIDLVNSDADYGQLLQQIRTLRSGRHFFNPAPIG